MIPARYILAASLLAAPVAATVAQQPTRPTMQVGEYDPRSTLVVPEHPKTRAKFPFIDVHGHQGTLNAEQAAKLVREMDELNMGLMVNLSGGSGDALVARLASLKGRYPTRFVIFANMNLREVNRPDFGPWAAAQLERDVKVGGASGLKVFKELGMDTRDANGNRIPLDDPRFDPVWAKAGELGIPVLIHTAEPAEFFKPLDKYNERWLELVLNPRRARPPDRYPPFDSLMAEQHRVFRKHSKTTFINAHLGWYGADLAHLGALMDSLPNMMTELGAVIYEIGRQPRAGRAFFIKYQDRIMMGKDSYEQNEYHTYFRIFETADEYFPYYRNYHAFWRMYGMDLPDSVLQKVYYRNALRVIPGIDSSRFPR
jgi:predicted TIM-barrel fold metal-dependent hydrolase